MDLQTLSVNEVLIIHNRLVEDFATSDDPIVPSGVKSPALLESAIGRQFTSLGSCLKYPNAIENAATLTFGLCCDHPFHNGNKRTALVSMLAHLDKNKLILRQVGKDDLFDMILAIANRNFSIRLDPRKRRPHRGCRADDEVKALSDWLKGRVREIKRGERVITYRQLRRILQSHGFSLENPSKNAIDVIKEEVVQKGYVIKREIRERKRIGSIHFPGDTRFVSIDQIKYVRKMCNLREEDGILTDHFYEDNAESDVKIDVFINEYRTILRRLAKM